MDRCQLSRVWRGGVVSPCLPWVDGVVDEYGNDQPGDYVILSPLNLNLLTRDETWINRSDMIGRLEQIALALPDEQLRAQVNDYLGRQMGADPDKKAIAEARLRTHRAVPRTQTPRKRRRESLPHVCPTLRPAGTRTVHGEPVGTGFGRCQSDHRPTDHDHNQTTSPQVRATKPQFSGGRGIRTPEHGWLRASGLQGTHSNGR